MHARDDLVRLSELGIAGRKLLFNMCRLSHRSHNFPLNKISQIKLNYTFNLKIKPESPRSVIRRRRWSDCHAESTDDGIVI